MDPHTPPRTRRGYRMLLPSSPSVCRGDGHGTLSTGLPKTGVTLTTLSNGKPACRLSYNRWLSRS